MSTDELRQEMADALHANDCGPGPACAACVDGANVLLPIVWHFAADELRAASDELRRPPHPIETALGGTSYVRGFLLDRAGVMDGGAR